MPRYIDRDTALSHPFANGQYDKENANEHFIFGFEGYKEWLEQLPTVDAEPVRHGHWEVWFENEETRQVKCSECRMMFTVGKGRDGNYCPNCGAKMDEV